jgi:hypothetical protein
VKKPSELPAVKMMDPKKEGFEEDGKKIQIIYAKHKN